jgi:hypothetical protein
MIGAPEEIRTPDPEIRSLVRPRDLRIELSAPFCLELPNNRHRKWGNFEGS